MHGNAPDDVESFVASLHNRLPQQIKNFISETSYILNYSEKHRLNLWWKFNQICKSFKKTGAMRCIAVWIWPWLCRIREIALDAACMLVAPYGFLSGYIGGLRSEMESPQIQSPTWKTWIQNSLKFKTDAVDGTLFNFKRDSAIFLLNLLPFIGVSLLPKLLNRDTGKDQSWPLPHIVIMGLANVIACWQGIYSSVRVKQTVKSINNRSFEPSQQVRQKMRVMLPLLPIHIKESTVDQAISFLPGVSRAFVISTHLYTLHRATHGILLNCTLFALGPITWMYLKDYR